MVKHRVPRSPRQVLQDSVLGLVFGFSNMSLLTFLPVTATGTADMSRGRGGVRAK